MRLSLPRLPLAASVSLLVLTLGLALTAPLYLNLYWMRILSNIFMFAAIAQGINIIAGYCGYPAFGNVVFFGLGAYATAIFMVRFGGSFYVGLMIGAAIAMVFAAVLGPPLLRLRGHYFAIATLGCNEAVKAIAATLNELTGGGMGLSVPLPPGDPRDNALLFYYLLLGVVLLGAAITAWLSVARIGYALRAIRDNETKAESMGIRTMRYKTFAWMISASLTGVVGGIYAYWFSYVEPPAVFDMTIAVKCFVIFMLGGAGTVAGPIVGAAVVELLATFAWSHLLSYHLGILGVVIIAIVLYAPHGLVTFVRARLSQMGVSRSDR